MSEEKIKELENTISEKDEKLNNQSSELDYLTNTIIPKLKEENTKLKSLKVELTDALENATEKYFVQLDINADLSEKLTKTGADHALNKVKLDKIEREIKTIKEDATSKVKEMKDTLGNYDPAAIDRLKEENKNLEKQLKEKNEELIEFEELVPKLKNEIDNYRKEIIEIGDYKEKVEAANKGNLLKLENQISQLNTELKIKQSSHDKLKADSERTIKNLEKENEKLRAAISKHENKGFFERLSNKSIEIDDE